MSRRVIVLDLDGVLFSNQLIQCLVLLCNWLPKGKCSLYLKPCLISVLEFLERFLSLRHQPNNELIRVLARRRCEDTLVICTDRSLKGLEYVWGIVSGLCLRSGDAVQFRGTSDKYGVAKDVLPLKNGVSIFVTSRAKPDAEVLREISNYARSIPVASNNVLVIDDDATFLRSARREHRFRTVHVEPFQPCVLDLRAA
jgi:hypothetical protein